MNKKTIIIIILLIILILGLIVGGTIFSIKKLSTIMEDKESITASEFYDKMEDKGYYLQDATNQFSAYDYIKQVYLALESDNKYQIEFYEFSDESYAMSFFENNKSIFESSKGNSASNTNINLENSSKYTLSNNGSYKSLSRIGNTLIYIDIDSQYKDEVKDILEYLGY